MGHRIRVYPHNDLFNLAHYHREVIEKKVSDGVDEGIGLDCMSCLVALAFAVEAIANFVGSKKVEAWKEKSPYHQKMNALATALGFPFDVTCEPYKTLKELKGIRDQMAHGKPIESTVAVVSRAALRRSMAAPWDDFLTPKFASHAFEQAKAFEHQLLTLSGISAGETLTTSVGSWKET